MENLDLLFEQFSNVVRNEMKERKINSFDCFNWGKFRFSALLVCGNPKKLLKILKKDFSNEELQLFSIQIEKYMFNKI